jgi:hypothetical protein
MSARGGEATNTTIFCACKILSKDANYNSALSTNVTKICLYMHGINRYLQYMYEFSCFFNNWNLNGTILVLSNAKLDS